MAEAGITVTGEAYSEEGITVEELVDHLWQLPKPKRKKSCAERIMPARPEA